MQVQVIFPHACNAEVSVSRSQGKGGGREGGREGWMEGGRGGVWRG